MRSLDIVDLHDYYDFSSNISEKAKEISTQVLKAQYRASSPLIYRLERQYGICRHIMIPAPSDALVFQTITEHLSPLLEKAQPTKKAYFSRDRHSLKLPHQFRETRYPWDILWPKFQKDIWKFTDACSYLVVTDITNFFDNIGLRELRHIVSSRIEVKEVILDLLFNIIEQLAWTPDYLPTSLKGLPTINVESFRLLPHVMLFEIDEVLNIRSNGNFVRWMDDINIGVNSKDTAYQLLGEVNDVLKSRGLALNLSKTIIYTATEAKSHFMMDENIYLDEVDKLDPGASDFVQKKVEFVNRFRSHLRRTDLRNWDRVTKRYFTIAAHLKVTQLQRYAYGLYLNYPSIRNNIARYLTVLGFTKSSAKIVLKLLRDVKRYDDVTLFELCRLITDWEIPRNSSGTEFIKAISKILSLPKSDFDLYCYLFFLAKYGEPYRLMNLIIHKREQWRNKQFLARQVVSVLPRIMPFKKNFAMQLLDEQMTVGPRDAASVAANIHSLLTVEKLSSHYLYQYLFPPMPQRPYPLPKYLILTSILLSTSLKKAEKKKVCVKAKEHISDPFYLHWLTRFALFDE
ncbi:MAG: RNA-directed DNA polymerase [Chloroflexota bacterium]